MIQQGLRMIKSLPLLCLLVLLTSAQAICQGTAEDKVLGKIIETNPEFPGGMEKFYEYVENKKPEAKGTGKIFVSFFVEEDGGISEATIVKGINKEVDQSILNMITSMPKWTPATLKGKAVRKKMVLPIDI